MAPATDGWSVLGAAVALRERRISAVELLGESLTTIERHNGGAPSFGGAPEAVNAWARLYKERAGETARAADERLAREGAEAPLLCGVPIGLKDLFAVAGLPLSASSAVLEGEVATADSAIWARLARAGMVLVGHTHTHEFALGGTTDQVGNPWDTSRSAGGSSGGSAAAVAAGMVPVATGTDTAGSLRIPAAACGISAIKPTFGRLPMDGVIPLARSLDHAGPMARTVADCAAVLAAMAGGPPPAVPTAPPAPFGPHAGAPPAPFVRSAAGSVGPLPLAASAGARPLAGTRIAVLPAPPGVELHEDVAAGVEAAAAACERLGATVLRPAPPAFAALGDFGAILHGEAAAYHVRHAEQADRYRPFLREVLAHARESASLPRYLAAQEARAGLVAEWEAWMDAERLDLMLQATVTDPAPPRTLGYAASAPAPDPWILLTFTWDMAGFPVVALPAGTGARTGLPVGVSLIARRGAEAPLVGAAINVQERELPPLDPVVREA